MHSPTDEVSHLETVTESSTALGNDDLVTDPVSSATPSLYPLTTQIVHDCSRTSIGFWRIIHNEHKLQSTGFFRGFFSKIQLYLIILQ